MIWTTTLYMCYNQIVVCATDEDSLNIYVVYISRYNKMLVD